MSCFPSRHGGIRLPDDEENSASPLSRDRNAFDLTVWDMVACGNCIPFLRKAEPMGPQLNYYDEEDDYEFEGLLNEQNQDHLPSFLSGNPFGKRGRRRRHRTEAEDEGFEGDEEEGEMEADAEHLENDQIDKFTELAGQEYRTQTEDYDLDDEEHAAAAQEEIEITRNIHRAQKLAAHESLALQDNYVEEYYPEYEDDNQMTNFTSIRNDSSNNLPFPTAHIAPVARTIPYVVDGVFELEGQENKIPVVEHTIVENAVEVGAAIFEKPVVMPGLAEPRAEQSSASSTQTKRHGRTSSTIFTAQLEDLTKKLSAIKNNVLASLDDGNDTKDEHGRKDADEVSLNDEELEEFTQRAAERPSSRKNSTRPESNHGPITGIADGGGLLSSPVISSDPFSFFNISASNSSGSNPPESYRNSEDSDAENILPAPVAKIASAAWTYANKTIQNVSVDDTAQKAAAGLQSLQGWLGKAASVAQKAANHVAEEVKTTLAFVGEEGERQRRSRDESINPERRRELDGRMRSLTANSLKPPQAQNVTPQLSVSTPTKGGFV